MMRSVSGGGLSFIAAGEGRPVIFVHGWAMDSSVWERQIEYFSRKGCRALALDLRGHGASVDEGPFTISQMAYDLRGFIHDMGFDRPFLVGWSMGGLVVLEYIGGHPRSAAGICLVGSTPKFTSSEDFPHGLLRKDVKGMKSRLKRDFARVLREFREAVTGEIPADAKSLVIGASPPVPEAAREGLEELARVDLRSVLEKIRIPALVVHGGRDMICPPGVSKYMAERIGGAELLVMEEAGHVPFLSDTPRFNRELERFVESSFCEGGGRG